MKDLHFNVNGQRLTRANVDDFVGIVSKSKGYLRCIFSFDDDWAGTKKIALFSTRRIVEEDYSVVANLSCMVPNTVTDGTIFYMKLVGKKPGYEIETNWIMIEQEV